jgi:hypothetical protein
MSNPSISSCHIVPDIKGRFPTFDIEGCTFDIVTLGYRRSDLRYRRSARFQMLYTLEAGAGRVVQKAAAVLLHRLSLASFPGSDCGPCSSSSSEAAGILSISHCYNAALAQHRLPETAQTADAHPSSNTVQAVRASVGGAVSGGSAILIAAKLRRDG